MAPPKKLPPLPTFSGKVIDRAALSEDEFKVYAYQYAFTSQPFETMWPAAIVYVADDTDIQKAIQYAAANDLGVAVRSGGHHYIGMSSTSGMNIQLDLSGDLAPSKAAYPYTKIEYEATTRTLTMGPGTTMNSVGEVCKDLGIFFPHGECCNVHTGGHTQTGGWSLITRSFGIMADHLQSIDIILASGEKRTVERHSTDALDQDLFFALVGGSPGNIGVVTATRVKALRDVDFPQARGIKKVWMYSKETMAELVQLCNEMNDDRNTPQDMNVSVLAVGGQHTPNFHPLSGTTFDDQMAISHPELTGTYKFNYGLPFISLVGVWANLEGAAVSDIDPVCKKWFERFLAVSGLPVPNFIGGQYGFEKPIPMSKQMLDVTWENPREYTLPFVKRMYLARNSFNLANPDTTNGDTLATWISERCEEIQSVTARGVKIAMQVNGFGGKAYNNPSDPVPMAINCRDANYFLGLDVFYDPTVEGAFETAKSWCDDNDLIIFANRYNFNFQNPSTRIASRVLWGAFTHGMEVANLDAQWKSYYDSEEVYKKLLAIKKAVDPKSVFSPNLFCIGASSLSRFAHLPGAKTGLAIDTPASNTANSKQLLAKLGKDEEKKRFPASALVGSSAKRLRAEIKGGVPIV